MRRVLPLLAVLLMGFAPAPFPKPGRDGRDDLAAMRGEWEVVGESLSGSPLRPAAASYTAVYDGNRVDMLTNGVAIAKWVVTLDPSKKPKRMDLKKADAPGQALLCIYKLDGDTLTFAYYNRVNAPERPIDFNPNRLMVIEVYKRKKR
jgi:uncharacterized protein (TIGR03067 family)